MFGVSGSILGVSESFLGVSETSLGVSEPVLGVSGKVLGREKTILGREKTIPPKEKTISASHSSLFIFTFFSKYRHLFHELDSKIEKGKGDRSKLLVIKSHGLAKSKS